MRDRHPHGRPRRLHDLVEGLADRAGDRRRIAGRERARRRERLPEPSITVTASATRASRTGASSSSKARSSADTSGAAGAPAVGSRPTAPSSRASARST
jgi:hypothetical protein